MRTKQSTLTLTIFFLLFILPLSREAGGPSVFAQGFTAHVGTVPGAYNFWFHAPAPPEADDEELSSSRSEELANAHYPLLIFLHGRSLCGRDLAKVKRYGAIDAVARGRSIDCYIMAPQNPGGSWNPHKIMNIVDWAVKNYNVDTTRIYVYGMSLGGYGTIDLAATYPDRIAAAMALCGGGSVKDLSGLSKLPLWIVHGTADRAVPVSASDRVVEAIKATGDDSRLIYTRMPGIDHGRPARIFYMGQTYDWLFSHSLLDPNREVNRDFVITAEMLQNAYQDLGRNFQPDYDE
ncbi:MAG: dienelactone hydrolase family protein [Bacteroidaceae bacterium]|nr:dienelactone hydrolase family protein [Bacteroidaceae bacterium]